MMDFQELAMSVVSAVTIRPDLDKIRSSINTLFKFLEHNFDNVIFDAEKACDLILAANQGGVNLSKSPLLRWVDFTINPLTTLTMHELVVVCQGFGFDVNVKTGAVTDMRTIQRYCSGV